MIRIADPCLATVLRSGASVTGIFMAEATTSATLPRREDFTEGTGPEDSMEGVIGKGRPLEGKTSGLAR